MTDLLAEYYALFHLRAFLQTRYEDQGTFNPISPRDWAAAVLGEHRPDLPSIPLTRTDLSAFCTSNADVLDCFLAVMAWGRQDAGKRGQARALNVWQRSQSGIRDRLEILRSEKPDRVAAFNLFSGSNEVSDLGVAYFTKLLYFFAPRTTQGADRYILDKWTARSVNLLAKKRLIHMSKAGDAVTRHNNAAIYDAYCTELEVLAAILNLHHLDAPLRAEDIELMLFASGGPGAAVRPWRHHVRVHWKTNAPSHRFSRDLVLTRARAVRELLRVESHNYLESECFSA
ncbi:Uncharacterised protein [Achromobacter sp. 2789STDY5608633]|jgi:hypothetical protein|uniref:8-oxoguanine DNA glycosylase OGG fold protein n=1 Tax=Achromobacter sp. 2789STDY5608633 TaxID=1806501 RepID=UPI0006C5DB7B|nr:hypothetical protein [Achromobacter sp. 2789STDY5608633]CUJ69777.1 Uncharacterised protein [Achromobacter sp. 2789STDY5608633]